MKVYVLEAIINNKLTSDKVFASRENANRYLEKLLDHYNLEVNEVVYKDNNHYQEFVCDNYNRIIVRNKTAAYL